MPFDAEGKLPNRLFVGEIFHLLQKHDAEHGVQLFGPASLEFVIQVKKLLSGKFVQNLFPKQVSPGGLQ